MTALTKPAAGQSYQDPQFATSIRRISNAAAGNWAVVMPMYSTVQAWNADESYMILYHTGGSAGGGHHLYNGKTYTHIKELDINPADIEQVYWDTTNPKVLYYAEATSHKLRKFNVDTDTHLTASVLHDFSTAPTSCSSSEDLSGGSDPMYVSWNSKNIGFKCGSKVFSYNIATNSVGTVVSVAAGGNGPQASPSGSLFFLNNNGAQANVRDVNMNLLRNLPLSPDEHASMGTVNGQDTFFSVQFGGTATGTLVSTNMADGTSRVIIGESTGYPYPPSGTHVSAISYGNPGWVAVSVVGDAVAGKMGQTLLTSEIVLANANSGGSVCRVAHHRSCASSGACGTIGYFAEPHPVISPSGTRILYGSDWDGGSSVDSYVVELPAYR